MAEKKSGTLQVFVVAFVLVILAVAVLSSLSDQTQENVERTYVYNEGLNAAGCFTPVNLTGTDFTVASLHTYANGAGDADCNFTLANVPDGWKLETANDCLLVNLEVANGTSVALTEDTDYYFNTQTGVVTLLNTSTNVRLITNNATYVDYTYCSDNYLTSSLGRTMLQTVLGIFALAILIIVIALVYKSFKDNE